ncbi:hypothetical protein V2G26_006927 [Clonostachys chloroleuca]
MGNTVSQLFPPKPRFTDKDVPDLQGKVYLVTGSNTGVGLELATILHSKNAKVYIAARSKDKSLKAIEQIRRANPASKGGLEATRTILESTTWALSCLRSLTPILAATAKEEEPGRVRVVWVASTAAEGFSHKPGGVPLDNLDYHEPYKDSGIVSVALHPGNLDTDMWKVQSLTKFLLRHTILYPIIFGAYTELFAGLSSQVSMEKSGSWIVPWGRIMPIRPDIVAASKTEEEGGSGIARKFWQWANDQVEPYV